MPQDFQSTAFQALVASVAVLFGVFGFLYSTFAMFSTVRSKEDLNRPPIVFTLRFVCQIISVMILVNALLIAYSLFAMGLASANQTDLILSIGILLLTFLPAALSLFIAFLRM